MSHSPATFGEMYIEDSSPVVDDLVDTATVYTITGFTAGLSTDDISIDHVNGVITVKKTGCYHATMSVSFSCDKQNVIHVHPYINDTTKNEKAGFERKISTPNDVGVAGMNAIMQITAGQNFRLKVQSDVANVEITYQHLNISIHRIGD